MEKRTFARPRVVVSRCLGFEACRYNGELLESPFLARLSLHAKLVTVCPEVAIGLGTPRDPIRVVREIDGDRLIQPSTGKDLTRPMEEFAGQYVTGLKAVEGFVLKSRSPSCGITDTKIHRPASNAALLGRGPGLFARAVLTHFPNAAVEDEGRLTDALIRDDFLTRIFTLAAFRRFAGRPTMGGLVKFQADHELLFMAFARTRRRALARIVTNRAGLRVPEVVEAYRRELALVFSRPSRRVSHLDVLLHAFGTFRRKLTAREKAQFLDLLTEFRDGTIPRSAPIAVVRGLITRFAEAGLASQAYFQPFPEDLLRISGGEKRGGR